MRSIGFRALLIVVIVRPHTSLFHRIFHLTNCNDRKKGHPPPLFGGEGLIEWFPRISKPLPPWLYGFETKSVQEFLNFWKDGGSKPLDHKVIRPGNTEPDGRIKQMAAKFYAFSASGTFPPFSASLIITCLCSQIFMAAEFAISPV